MGKIVLAIVVGLVLYLLLRGRRRARPPGMPPAPPAEAMVRCERCGLYLPPGDAVLDGNRQYCCEEHRRLGRS